MNELKKWGMWLLMAFITVIVGKSVEKVVSAKLPVVTETMDKITNTLV